MGVVAFVGVFNAVIDPYILFDMPRVAGINALKPSAETHERMMKSYDVRRILPNSLVLGTSRADYGLDAQHPAWPVHARPVYNLAFAVGTPYMSYRYLQHVLSQRKPKLVVMGLDFEYFIKLGEANLRYEEPAVSNLPDYELRLATTRDGTPNSTYRRQHIVDLLRMLSLSALRASITTVVANQTGTSRDMISGSLVRLEGGRPRKARELSFVFAIYNIVAVKILHGTSRTATIDRHAMARLQAILDLCALHGTQVILFVSPSHADALEIFHKAGLWPLLEDWKRSVVSLVCRYSDACHSNAVLLWDFNGYDGFSTERVSSNQNGSRTFWDPDHYKRIVGDAIIMRIFGGEDTQFGTLLNVENVDSHLAEVRVHQQLYRERHPVDARRVRSLYEAVVQKFFEKNE